MREFPWAKDTDTVPLPVIKPTQTLPVSHDRDAGGVVGSWVSGQADRARRAAQERSAQRTRQDTERGHTIRRASGLTRRRAYTTTITYLGIAFILWASYKLQHPIVDPTEAAVAWKVPLAALALLGLPALIRLRVPGAWILPILFALPTGVVAWRAWKAIPPVPTECGVLGRLADTCTPYTWPAWGQMIVLAILTLKCLLLAWSAWEDSITEVRVDYKSLG